MTPAEAFNLLRARRLEEICRERNSQQLSNVELADVLRLYGYCIPRLDSEDAAIAWLDSEDGNAVLMAE